jgi:hypothetical protein
MYALVENGAVVRYPYTVTDLRRAYRDTSFPNQVSDEALLDFGMHKVESAAVPSFSETQVLEEGTPVFDQVRQCWSQVFTVRDMTPAELQQRYASQAAQIREERNSRLVASDWTQLADSTADKAAWATHRQSLRDITAQTGFPWTVDWPEQP